MLSSFLVTTVHASFWDLPSFDRSFFNCLQCADVPNWMFITWISQLVALLDKEEGAAIHDTLISLAKDYPQALYYPLKISSCNFKFGSDAVGRANQDALSKYDK